MEKLSFKIFLILSFTILKSFSKNPSQEKKRDSVSYFIEESNHNNSVPLKKKLLFLSKAIGVLNAYPEDSIKCTKLSEIAYRYHKLRDTLQFKIINKKAHQLAVKLNDSLNIADTHWNYGLHYNNLELHEKSFFHYNKAYQYFDKLNKIYKSGRMLYAMAYIKGRYKDYQSSEVLIFEAIKKFNLINHNEYLYNSYNHLGQLQKDIKEYDKAIFYYTKSLIFFKKIKNKEHIGPFNNLANVFLKKKKYLKALELYNKDLKRKMSLSHSARVLNNKAYCKLLMKDTVRVKKDLFYSLRIRDSLGNKAGVADSNIFISDYYKYLEDTVNAIKHAKEANVIAKKIKNGDYYLTTLKQLADLDVNKSKKYLDRYIIFNDSLIREERRAQNKFTRIEFETDEYIEEAEKLTQQNLLIIISSIGTILVLILLLFIRVQRSNNEKLRLEAEQQKANEEVYILTLEQQAKLEEERVNERNRISAELHDGVLGKLFGTRVNLGFLGMQMKTETQVKHQAFLDELQTIEKEIRDVSHKLSDNFDDASINFSTILKQLLKEKSVVGSFEYNFKEEKIDWKKINQITKANVYRIIQEALQNIIKHAKAKNVTLDVSIVNQNLVMTLKDDGVGFDMKKSKKGIGLKNIKSRLKKLHGTLDLVSEINKGTTLIINSPYNKNEQ